jgi:hypothetical protein
VRRNRGRDLGVQLLQPFQVCRQIGFGGREKRGVAVELLLAPVQRRPSFRQLIEDLDLALAEAIEGEASDCSGRRTRAPPGAPDGQPPALPWAQPAPGP